MDSVSTKKKTKPMPIKSKPVISAKLSNSSPPSSTSSSSSNGSPQASISSSVSSSSSGSSSNDSPRNSIQTFVKRPNVLSGASGDGSNVSNKKPSVKSSKSASSRIGFGLSLQASAAAATVATSTTTKGQSKSTTPMTLRTKSATTISETSIFTRKNRISGISNTIAKISSTTFGRSLENSNTGNSAGISSSVNIPSDILDDLASRFIINVPDDERNNLIRICFQIELAHWFYLDFFCTNSEKKLLACGMKQFAIFLFQHIPFLKVHLPAIDKILDDWKQYKLTVPTYGAILLSENLTHVLLVQSYWAKSSWGFPKGKVNENENPIHCAAREVFEETGYDITNLINQTDYIESVINYQYTRLYIVRNIPLKTHFAPRTRKEIKCCEWFPIDSLPTSKNDINTKLNLGINANSFFMIMPFVKRLKKWINDETRLSSNEQENRFVQHHNYKSKLNCQYLNNSNANYGPLLSSKKSDSKLSFNLTGISPLTTVGQNSSIFFSNRTPSSGGKRQRHKSMGDIDGVMKNNNRLATTSGKQQQPQQQQICGGGSNSIFSSTNYDILSTTRSLKPIDNEQSKFYERDKSGFKPSKNGTNSNRKQMPNNSGDNKFTKITTNLLIESNAMSALDGKFSSTSINRKNSKWTIPTSSTVPISSYHYDYIGDGANNRISDEVFNNNYIPIRKNTISTKIVDAEQKKHFTKRSASGEKHFQAENVKPPTTRKLLSSSVAPTEISNVEDIVRKTPNFNLWRDFSFTKNCISNVFC